MDGSKTALERAFEMARSGKVADISDLRRNLAREGYAGEQVKGPALVRQLTALIRTTRAAGAVDQALPGDASK